MKNLFKFLSVLSPAHIRLFTLSVRGKKVGQDAYGNTYYKASPRKGQSRPRRWVVYQGKPEASRVPPEWHGWLHHQSNIVPTSETATSYRRSWQKPPQENLTGTKQAYRPSDYLSTGKPRAKVCGDYEAWSPPE